MKNLLFYIFLSVSFIFGQSQIGGTEFEIKVISNSNRPLNNLKIYAKPIYSGTQFNIFPKRIDGGNYRLFISSIYQSFELEIEADKHETFSMICYHSTNKQINVTLLYNDYYEKFNVNNNELFEDFGTSTLKVEQCREDNLQYITDEYDFDFQLPFPKQDIALDDKNYLKHASISKPVPREKYYHDLLKEIVLQTSAQRSEFAISGIDDIISENIDTYIGKDLNQISDISLGSYDIVGELINLKLPQFGSAIKNAGLSFSLFKAAKNGLLEGLYLAMAYQGYQEECYLLIKNKAKNSVLYEDNAFKHAIERLDETIKIEQNKQIQQLVNNMLNQSVNGEIAQTVIKGIISTGLSNSLKLIGAGSAASSMGGFLIVDVFSGLKDNISYNSHLLLLSQINHYLLDDYSDSYTDDLPDKIKTDNSYLFGTLMKIHTGFLYHQIREEYFSGKNQGIVFGLLAKENLSLFHRKMVEISISKKSVAEFDYFLVSQLKSVEENKTDKKTIVLIMDSSGSMSKNDPKNIRIEACKMIVNQISNQDNLIIVDFDSYAKILNKNNFVNWNRDSLIASINTIDSDGGTNIGLPLLKLQNFIEYFKIPITNGGVILLTDGLGDYTNEAEWFRINNFPIYTISFAGEGNLKLLKSISDLTGGQYYSARSTSDIFSRFQDFYNSLSGGNRIMKLHTKIELKENKSNYFFIDPSIKSYTSYVQWLGSTVDLRLKSPSGKVFDKYSSNIQWIQNETSIYTKINEPEIGKWEYELIGTDIPSSGEQLEFEINALINSSDNYSLEIDEVHSNFKYGKVHLKIEPDLVYEKIISNSYLINTDKDTLKIEWNNQNDLKFLADKPGNYEVHVDFIISQGTNNIMRSFYKNIYVGEVKPGYIGNIFQIESNLIIHSDLGLLSGNQIANHCLIYKKGTGKLYGYGTIVQINENSSKIHLLYKNPMIDLSIGDIVEVDKQTWQKD